MQCTAFEFGDLMRGRRMGYFLRTLNRSKGVYLVLYKTYWHDIERKSKQRVYESLGYESELRQKGIADPIQYYRDVARRLSEKEREERAARKRVEISACPWRYIGYFPLRAVLRKLDTALYIDKLQSSRGFEFRVFDLLEALVLARCVEPASKRSTLCEVIPLLFNKYEFSYHQVLDGLAFMGDEYEKIIEIFTRQIRRKFTVETEKCYFDATNFYFEIDREDELRRKGPSKEHRPDPIVGMGLLLDAHRIPLGMKIFPGNESEKPVLRDVINDLKQRNAIRGRTVQVADKGLNCAQNILTAIAEGDGYLFSKGVRGLSAVEKKWVLHDQDWEEVYKGDKLLYKIKECEDDFEYSMEKLTGQKTNVSIREKRVVTFNPALAEKQTAEIRKMADKAARLTLSKAKRSQFGESAKFVNFTPTDRSGQEINGKVTPQLNQKAIDEALELSGYNMIVTSELDMTKFQIYETYHNLWVIEHSFRLMKSYLDARPVYVQKHNSIKGHFLICYLGLLLLRLLQTYVLQDQYSAEQLMNFAHELRIVKNGGSGWINITTASEFVSEMGSLFDVLIKNYFLTTRQVTAILNKKI